MFFFQYIFIVKYVWNNTPAMQGLKTRAHAYPFFIFCTEFNAANTQKKVC